MDHVSTTMIRCGAIGLKLLWQSVGFKFEEGSRFLVRLSVAG